VATNRANNRLAAPPDSACTISNTWRVSSLLRTRRHTDTSACSGRMGGVGGAALGGAVLALGGFSAVGFLCLGVALVSAIVLQFGMSARKPSDQ